MLDANNGLKPRSKIYIYFISLSIAAGSFVMGYALVGTALLQEYIQVYNNIPKTQIEYYLSIIITLLPFGAIVGIKNYYFRFFIFTKFNKKSWIKEQYDHC